MKRLIERKIKFRIYNSTPNKVKIERVKVNPNKETYNKVIMGCYSVSEIESMKGYKK